MSWCKRRTIQPSPADDGDDDATHFRYLCIWQKHTTRLNCCVSTSIKPFTSNSQFASNVSFKTFVENRLLTLALEQGLSILRRQFKLHIILLRPKILHSFCNKFTGYTAWFSQKLLQSANTNLATIQLKQENVLQKENYKMTLSSLKDFRDMKFSCTPFFAVMIISKRYSRFTSTKLTLMQSCT